MRAIKSTLYLAITMTMLRSLLLAPFGLAAQEQATQSKPYNVYFQTYGVPVGISLTISGTHTNPGHKLKSYSTTFTSPGPSDAVTNEPFTEFTYSDFPASLDVSGRTYTLVSTSPASPFTIGASGRTTTVTATYSASCQPPSFTSDPASQTVTFGDPVTFTASAEGTDQLYFQWSLDGNPIIGATQSTYSIPAAIMDDAGAYTVTVTDACSSATSATAALTMNQANQTISFDPPASPAVYSTTFTVAPTANSGLPVTLVASGSCSNTAFDVTMTSGEGDCTLTASQPGDLNYNAAWDVVHTVQAAKAEQTINFAAPATPAVYNTVFAVAPAASTGLPVTLVASGSCTNTAFDVTMTSGEGDCTLTASQPGDTNYNAAPDVVHTVQAAKAEQTITFEQPTSPVEYLATFSLSYSVSSGLAVSVVASQSCILVDDVTAQISVPYGACVLTASQPGDSNYSAAQQVMRTVDLPFQEIIFAPIMLKP